MRGVDAVDICFIVNSKQWRSLFLLEWLSNLANRKVNMNLAWRRKVISTTLHGEYNIGHAMCGVQTIPLITSLEGVKKAMQTRSV